MSFPTPRRALSTASIDHLLSKSLKPQIVRTQPKPGETSLSWRTPHLDTPSTQRPALPQKAGGRSTRSIQGVTGIRDGVPPAARATWKQAERGAQRPDRKRGSQLMLGV